MTPPPDSNIGWAIASLILCWPFCIPAFIASSKVSSFWVYGQRDEAYRASADAKKWGRIGVIVGCCLIGAYLLFMIIFMIFFSTMLSHLP